MALTDDQISTIKGILHPEQPIREKPATSQSVPVGVKLPPDSSVIVTMDLQQERLAKDIRDGHRLFYGVAGSGKTLILLARAKALANRLVGHRTLILCFNITLAAYLRSLIQSDKHNPHFQERIQVLHFHDWAKLILGRLPNPEQVVGDYDQVLGGQLLKAIAALAPDQKWDSILIDEAHTFSPKWFECCVAALKDPENGDLLVVSDGSQSLYTRGKFSWRSVGVKAQGRTKRLVQNYRNTQEVLSAAWSLVEAIATHDVEEDEDVSFPVVAPSTALRHGPRPVLQWLPSETDELMAIVQQVQALCDRGYEPQEIAILYRRKQKGVSQSWLFDKLQQQLKQLGLGVYWVTESNETKRNYSVQKPGVRLVTTLSSLGLEFRAVLVVWLHQFDDCLDPNPEVAALARRQLYVAMTRARDELYLFGSGKSVLRHDLSQNPHLEIVAHSSVVIDQSEQSAIASGT